MTFDHVTSKLLLSRMLGHYQLDMTGVVIDIVNIVQCKHFAQPGPGEAREEKHQPIPFTGFPGRGSDGGVIVPFLESGDQGDDLVREEFSQSFRHKEVELRFPRGHP